MSPPKAALSKSPCKSPKTDIAQENVSKARERARSSKTVLDPDRIHCSIVSSKIRAFRELGRSRDPGSGRYIGFSSKVLWQGDKLAEAKKNTRNSVLSKNSNSSCPTFTHWPVRSARSPSQCFFSYIGVAIMARSYGQILRRVPVVPLCSDKKNRGTTSLQASGAARWLNGAIRAEFMRFF